MTFFKNRANSTECFRKIFSRKFNENFEKSKILIFREKNRKFSKKIKTFDFSNFSSIFRENMFRKMFGQFVSFLKYVTAFEWIVLQGEMIFLLQVFLCYKVWTSSLWKKLSGHHRCNKQFYFWVNTFFVTDFSESTFHLPGECDLSMEYELDDYSVFK